MKHDIFQQPPISELGLSRDLKRIGVRDGEILIVHSSLSAVGWVLGGAPTVVAALLDALGEKGTLVMPSATPMCADPSLWPGPEVPEEFLDAVRDDLPEFDKQTTPTTMGVIAETFRIWPGTARSDHPLESICSWGPASDGITGEHPLAYSEGPNGPFGKLHDLDARILLLGVGFNRCTALHFAETLVTKRREQTVRFPMRVDGERVWCEVRNVADDNDTHFPIIGEQFLATGKARTGTIGRAPAILCSIRDLTRFARDYFERHL